jgi:DNA (cytosine-5)-methyltransferase 1
MFDGPAPSTRARTLKVADLFCGAGGTAKGAQRALERAGYRMDLVAINHDAVAVKSHAENFPEARHYISDVNAVRPLEAVPEGWLDLLMASPTCTHHSRARGGRPTSDQQRMDPWAVVAWLGQIRVKRLLCENVPEFVDWGPVDRRTGKPMKSRKGEYFRAWISALEAHGFKVEWRILNCADYGDPTTRVRWFLMARSDGKPIRWPTPTHAPAAKAELLGLKPWRAAREIIDWSIPGKSIFDRARPLSINTLRRIEAGIVKFGWPSAFLVVLRQHMTAVSVDGPAPTVTAGGNHLYLAQVGEARPFMLPQRSDHDPTRTVDDPAPTLTTVARVGVVEPFLFPANQGADRQRGLRDVDQPAPTITATGTDLGLVEPFIISTRQHTGGPVPRAAGEPVPTLTASDSRVGVVEPFMLSPQSEGAPRSIADPVPGITTTNAPLIIEPAPMISPYYGSSDTCKSVDEPLDTVTSHDRFGLVVPITHADRSNRARSVDDPVATITTANRGELAFVAAAFGERPGQAPRVHDISAPCPTVCAEGRVTLVEGDRPRVDIRFRMFEPHELAGAMSLADHKFLGNKTQKTRQIGNAVPGEMSAALVGALL